LRILRRHIAANWEDFLEITNQRSFRKMFGSVQGERMAHTPSGFPADHPAIDVLRQKQFFVAQTEPAELAEQPKLYQRLCALFSAMIPFVQFLNLPLKSRMREEFFFGIRK
jgi:uncharacterized protein (DUF2461 family)